MISRLFVYGTLVPGQEPALVRAPVARMTPVGPATVAGSLYDLGPYPGAVLDGSGGRVFGYVFEVPDDDSFWRALDAYEGFDPRHPDSSLFRRENCVALLDSNAEIECQIYLYNDSAPEKLRVLNGRWQPARTS